MEKYGCTYAEGIVADELFLARVCNAINDNLSRLIQTDHVPRDLFPEKLIAEEEGELIPIRSGVISLTEDVPAYDYSTGDELRVGFRIFNEGEEGETLFLVFVSPWQNG